MSSEDKISQEQADDELRAWLARMDLRVEPARMDPDSVKGWGELSTTITRALREGHLFTNDAGDLELMLKSKVPGVTSLKFGEPSGLAWRQMDKVPGEVSKLYAFAAAQTKVDLAVFDQSLERDLRVVRAIVQVFLALK